MQLWFILTLRKIKLTINPNYPPSKLNAPFLSNKKIIIAVISFVQESETGSGLISVKDAVPICNDPHEMGHIQGLTLIKFENIVVKVIITETVVQHRSKATEMLFY